MSRKVSKGYFVKGHFIAEGSELDQELKRESKGGTDFSKSDLKRASAQLQELGRSLIELSPGLLQKLLDKQYLTGQLFDAVQTAKSIHDFEGKRRQVQFIGKLMRKLEEDQIHAIKDAIQAHHQPNLEETQLLHNAEKWRTQLLEDDQALQKWLGSFPGTDVQQLRTLIRQSIKDNTTHQKDWDQGLPPRQSRAFRELFQFIKHHLIAQQTSAEDRRHDTDYS